MKKINQINCNCPSCSTPMEVSALECKQCDLQLRGQFESHPLMKLDGDLLHFLHVFIVCEGKIADMEKALGISYPTVKNKIQKLKDFVSLPDLAEKSSTQTESQVGTKSVVEILELMNRGLINYEKGLSLIKLKTEKKK